MALLLLALLAGHAQTPTLGVIYNLPGTDPGFVLFSPLTITNTYLINKQGQVLHVWHSAYLPGLVAYLRPDGKLIRAAKDHPPGNDPFGPTTDAGGMGGRVERLAWDSMVEWSWLICDSKQRQHHDVCPLPNGNVVMSIWVPKTPAEMAAAGRNTTWTGATNLNLEKVIEVRPTGTNQATVVWEWQPWDHLIQDYNPSAKNFGNVAAHPELIDFNYGRRTGPNHEVINVNAIHYNAKLDELMLESRWYGEVWVVDHSTTTAEAAGHTGGRRGKGGDLLYRWGNPATYHAGTTDDQVLFQSHEGKWIEPGLPGSETGDVTVFDNGTYRPGGPRYSRLVQFTPPLQPDGSYAMITNSFATNGVYGPASYNWICPSNPAPDFFAFNQGGCTRLPNGNTLSCLGPEGYFVEWTPLGDRVWGYQSPVGGETRNHILSQGQRTRMNANVWKVISYPTNYIGFQGHDLTPQGVLELPRPPGNSARPDKSVTPKIDGVGPPPEPPSL
ncbi:MAG TPA: hypothetical protein VMU04_20820 [Candidatus Acidoferrum sp.]|nr:hypothetical protein [Candidatus Acidoferrum sp.]